MKRFILVRVVSLLEDSDVVGTALMQIVVFVSIDRVDLQTDIPEIFPRQLTCLSNVFDITLRTALSGQHQDFLNAGICDDLHLCFHLCIGKLLSVNVVVAVETAVHTVILAIVRNV